MLRMLAGLLCAVGCCGYGISWIYSYRKEIRNCNQFQIVFLKLKNRLLIERDILAMACLKIAKEDQQSGELIKEFFLKVGSDSIKNTSIEFSDIWKNEVEKQWKTGIKNKELYQLLYTFPEYMNHCDLDTLKICYEHFLTQWETNLNRCLTDQRKNEKLVFTISLFVGLIITILLI